VHLQTGFFRHRLTARIERRSLLKIAVLPEYAMAHLPIVGIELCSVRGCGKNVLTPICAWVLRLIDRHKVRDPYYRYVASQWIKYSASRHAPRERGWLGKTS
jgi:hypothetical protein